MIQFFICVSISVILCLNLFGKHSRLIDLMYGSKVEETKFMIFSVGIAIFFMTHSMVFNVLFILVLGADIFNLIDWKKYNWLALNEKVEADLSK